MHYIAELRIENFRSCIDTELKLEPYSPLVGYNNAGKSNLLRAIDCFVRGSSLGIEDFYDPAQPVHITISISGLTTSILGSLPPTCQSAISDFVDNEVLKVRFLQSRPKVAKKEIQFQVRSLLPTEEPWLSNVPNVSKTIKCLFPEPTFIQSMEDSAEDVTKYKATNTIGKILGDLRNVVAESQADLLSDALQGIGKKLNHNGIERLQELDDLDEEINSQISDFFPGLSLNVHIPTPSLEDLFKKGTVVVSEERQGSGCDFSSMGHGAQRAIQMNLLCYLAKNSRTSSSIHQTTLLLVDEPELFLHPQAIEQIRRAFKLLSENGYQVVFSTHSPLIIDKEDIPSTNLIRKGEQGTYASQRLVDAAQQLTGDRKGASRLLFSIDNLSQILFSDKVLIVEGATEKVVMPALLQKVTGKTFAGNKLALVVAGGSNGIPGMMKILETMGIPYKVLADLDFAFQVAHKHNFLTEDFPCRKKCFEILKFLQTEHLFSLEGGYPTKGNGFTASQIYELLADFEESQPYIENICEQIKGHNVWVWKSGAIEKHLSLDAKNTGAWQDFNSRLFLEPWEEVVDDSAEIQSMFAWALG